jgi:hypothetical protein
MVKLAQHYFDSLWKKGKNYQMQKSTASTRSRTPLAKKTILKANPFERLAPRGL